MTIQLSVTLWTLLCFLALILILNNLLFKPVLRVMDARRARIGAAKDKAAEYARIRAQNEQERKEALDARERARQKQLVERVDALRQESREAVDAARTERLAALDRFREKTEAEREEILATLSAHSEELAAAFARSVIGK